MRRSRSPASQVAKLVERTAHETIKKRYSRVWICVGAIYPLEKEQRRMECVWSPRGNSMEEVCMRNHVIPANKTYSTIHYDCWCICLCKHEQHGGLNLAYTQRWPREPWPVVIGSNEYFESVTWNVACDVLNLIVGNRKWLQSPLEQGEIRCLPPGA